MIVIIIGELRLHTRKQKCLPEQTRAASRPCLLAKRPIMFANRVRRRRPPHMPVRPTSDSRHGEILYRLDIRSLSMSQPSRTRSVRPSLERLEGRLLPAVTFTIDPTLNQQPISRFIYGINGSLTGATSNLTLTRAGGNRWTAYNWENNASNAGSDWFYQNDGYLGGGNTPGGAVAPTLNNAQARDAAAIITIPINGYVSADKNADGDVRNSGANYLQTRFRQSVAIKGAPFTLTPNTGDAFVYTDEFVNWVNVNYPGQSDPSRPVFYSLDNEPDLWASTHAEVHPNPVTYAEMVQKTIDHAAAIKSVAPNSKVFGPVNYGWNGFTTLQDAPDRNGRDFQTFYLSQMKTAEQTYGKRLVDALDVHWYPEAQGGGVRVTQQNNTAAVVAARLQAPRSLWDPTYTETSWITQWSTFGPINLINRLEGKINANYPGTKLAITEYNYGGGDHISGGIAQADVLGIFGREGVYAASQWKLYSSEPFVTGAFSMFRNYDGQNSTFGNTSVSATTSSAADSSIYASIDSNNPNVMVLVAINKTGAALPATLNLNGVPANSIAKFYTLTSSSSTPQAAGQSTIANPSAFAYTMPAYSVTTMRVELNTPPPPALTGTIINGGTPELLNLPTAYANQRSMVKSVKLTFDSPVTLATGAVSLAVHPNPLVSNPTLPGDLVVRNASGGTGLATDWIITFAGANVIGGSIADGEYDLTINPNLVINATGQHLATQPSTFTFYRLLGDADGNRTVNTLDIAAIRREAGTTAASPNYLWLFDADWNGTINTTDIIELRRRAGRTI
jgi:hypothetical protein